MKLIILTGQYTHRAGRQQTGDGATEHAQQRLRPVREIEGSIISSRCHPG